MWKGVEGITTLFDVAEEMSKEAQFIVMLTN